MPSCPIKINEIHTVEIFSIGRNGDGIAKIENFVVIIPEARFKEKVKVRIEKVFPKYAFGRILE